MKYIRHTAILLVMTFFLSLIGCAGQSTLSLPDKPSEGIGVATVCAVGDLFPTDDMLADAKQADGSYDFKPQFANIISDISAADIALGNLEGNFDNERDGEGNYPAAFASALAHTGFDLLQTANSFTIQNGLSGLERTKSVIASENMTALGSFSSKEDRAENAVILREVHGIRIAFVAFTKGMNGMGLPSGAEYCVNLLYTDYSSNYSVIDTAGITKVLEEAKTLEPDVIIAALHWGSENVDEISESQEKIADLMFQNGVDVIIGSHSHRVGAVEYRTITEKNGNTKNVVLAYGLGDFCAGRAGNVSGSVILNLEFTRDHAKGTTTITRASCTPVATVDNGTSTERFSVLNADAAIALYEDNYYKRVSETLYEQLLSVRNSVLESIAPDVAE